MPCVPTANDASCDFTILVEGSEYKSHREILSSASNYFDALFRSNMRETQEGRVELQGMTSETFAVVLNFIHQRVHGLTADNIDDIWDAANRLDIAIYLKEIEQFVIENLSIDNLWHFYLKAIDYNSTIVKDGSLMFMKQKYEHLFRMKEFLNLPFELVLSCIEDDELNVRTEDSALESILTWVSHGTYRPGAILSRDISSTGVVDGQQPQGVSHFCDVTTFGQSCGVVTIDSENEDEAGEHGSVKPDCVTKADGVTNDGQTDDGANNGPANDVTKNVHTCHQTDDGQICDVQQDFLTDDSRKQLHKLMSSAKIILATDTYLQGLLSNPFINECPDIYRLVQEALKYKRGLYPFESTLLIPYRNCTGKRNCMAFLGVPDLHLFDLENGSLTSVKLNNLNGRNKTCVSVVSLGSRLGFVCIKYRRDCPYAEHKCRPTTVLMLDESKNLSTLYEVCGKQNMPIYLVNVNGKILNVCHAATRSRIMDPELFKIVKLEIRVKFNFACVFENDILLFKNKDIYSALNGIHDMQVSCYNLETKSLTTTKILNVGSDNNISVIHKDKETFLLLSSGVLLSVKRGSDNEVKFTPVAHLWTNFQWLLNGAVCYKNDLTLFSTEDHVSYGTVLASVPGLFEKIRVVKLGAGFSNVVPVVAPVSWFVS